VSRAAASAAIASARLAQRFVCCRIRLVSTRNSRSVTASKMPVRPCAAGGGEDVRVLRGRAGQHPPVGQRQFHRRDMRAEAAGAVMVLAVHVGRHRAAEGDEFGARRDRQEPALRQHAAIRSPSSSPASAVTVPASGRTPEFAAAEQRQRRPRIERGIAIGAAIARPISPGSAATAASAASGRPARPAAPHARILPQPASMMSGIRSCRKASGHPQMTRMEGDEKAISKIFVKKGVPQMAQIKSG